MLGLALLHLGISRAVVPARAVISQCTRWYITELGSEVVSNITNIMVANQLVDRCLCSVLCFFDQVLLLKRILTICTDTNSDSVSSTQVSAVSNDPVVLE